MSPFIRIFVPDSHRTNYWVTLFLLNGSSPEVHEAETEEHRPRCKRPSVCSKVDRWC